MKRREEKGILKCKKEGKVEIAIKLKNGILIK
jgi:hypothetical protein